MQRNKQWRFDAGNAVKKLGEGKFVTLSIKCPSCGTMNILWAVSPGPAGPGASFGGASDDSQQEETVSSTGGR